jgi:hypothetical protein
MSKEIHDLVTVTELEDGDELLLQLAGGGNSRRITAQDAKRFQDGSATGPSISFVDDQNSGGYRLGADNMGWSMGGTLVMSLGNNWVRFGDGNATTPTIGFINDTDKGFYSSAANVIGAATGSGTTGMLIQSTGITVPKASGSGIKIDTASAGYGWHDLLGAIVARNTGLTAPGFVVYRGGIYAYQFAVNDEAFIEFHMPHDWAPGTDIYIHAHWSHTATTVTGGSVTWGFEVSYAKGHNQAAFSAPVTATILQNASTTQYQHMIAEVQLSAASPSASQIDTDNLEVDGLILCRVYLSANAITVSGGAVPDPFLHFVDIHYQTTNVGTKQKAPNFYT